MNQPGELFLSMVQSTIDSCLLFCTFANRSVVSPIVLAFDDFKHLFRAFFAIIFEPKFYNLCNTCLEKLHVILDESIMKMFTGKVDIIAENFVVIIISEPKISLIEELIVFDMIEQLQIVIAVKTLCDFIFV